MTPLPSAPALRPSWLQRLTDSRLFCFAAVFGLQLLIFSLVAGWVVFKAESVTRRHDEETKFQMVKIALPPALAQVKLPEGSPVRTNVMGGLGEQMSHLFFELPLLTEGGSSSSVGPPDSPPSLQSPMPPEQTAPGNQPVQPPPLAADAPSSPSPPYGKVKPVNIDMEQNGESNIWIYVGLNGGGPHRYLLDTGSWGFYALYSPKWWPGNPQSLFKTNGFDTEFYGNMTYGYSFVPVFSSVSLYNYFNGVQAYQFPEKDYAIAKAFTWYDDYEPQKGIARPNDSITKAIQSANENGDDTLDNHGIFGAGTCIQFKGSDALGYANLSNLLAQTPGDGYVITDNGPLGKATLTIGLNEAIRSQFTQHLSLRPNYESGGFPNTHWPSCGPPVVQITLSRTGHQSIVFRGHFWIDSGSSDSNVKIPDDASGSLKDYIADDNSIVPDTTISVSDPSRQDGLDYTTVIPGKDETVHPFSGHSVKRGTGEIGIWFGMDFFRHNSVLYDFKNGVMGFSPRRPELDQSVLDSP